MNRIRALCWLTGLALTIAVSGCSSSDNAKKSAEGVKPSSASIVEGEQPTQGEIDHMLAAKEALFTRLSSRLMEAIGSGGPSAAISVCKHEAPEIAKEVSAEQGLLIGRTGVRLRNPNNTAPKWAAALTEAKTDKPTFAKLSDGHAAALLPIKLQGQCLMCHGPTEQIAPVIQEQLSKLYPNDQATGFQEGELRGWFWIDLPNG